ncbi:helix-turn-helix transcriptional regulator [Arthrobacter sp. ok362]|jgi:DNA-binding transcriptional ArsR family regulator|uniref:ArsR/SmtB family transcription factor n=1 Tax=Arthrobacter sp. ok362 TaxID=1761745 RepID=UPI00087FC631|nr:metalloregulator ArsR/SmtB family transcription factor [Arthrobacter sp. ok362]SDK61284.1 transcriptional regulator, ArsR family [Arthrobacter sp. ok362]
MVVDQLRAQLSEEELDRLFQAFADTTRRDIVRRVTVGEYSVSGLAALYAMSFAAVQKHVAVLERASLVSKEKRGREQIVRANHDGLQRARRLLDEYEVIWRQRADRIADLLAETAITEPDKTGTGNTQTKNAQSNITEGKLKDRKGSS